MKYFVDGIIVVEGISDVAFLSEFIEAEFVTTNGSEIPTETWIGARLSSPKHGARVYCFL